MVLAAKRQRRTKEQVKALWHRRAKTARPADIICFRCGTVTNKIHHHCVGHKYGKGYSVSVCTRCHGEINALVWNPEKHLLRGPYWGEKPEKLLLPERLEKPNFFDLLLQPNNPTEIHNGRSYGQNGDSYLVTVVSVTHKNTGEIFYVRGGSYGELSRITGVPRSMIVDSYIGTYPLLIVNEKEYAAGFGPLADYWIRDIKKESIEAYYRNLPEEDTNEDGPED